MMKAHNWALKDTDAFQAVARPLVSSGGTGRLSRGESGQTAEAANDEVKACLADLAQGPYFVIASFLDIAELCRTDASCSLFCQLNRTPLGPWRALGIKTFDGIELEQYGLFEKPTSGLEESEESFVKGWKQKRIDWKCRFCCFWANAPTFSAPFNGSHITSISHPDEVAYFKSRLCTDDVDGSGVYLEVEVSVNPDNLSLAVVDFEAGGCSSVTFSPDTGAVIRERKVREDPRKVEGAYIQPLTTLPPGRRFTGTMGLYLYAGSLAFFRRYASAEDGRADSGSWESTGFVSDLSWAEGGRLTPSLAFRGEGEYSVRIVRVDKTPPLDLGRPTAELHSSVGWNVFDWEVGDQEEA